MSETVEIVMMCVLGSCALIDGIHRAAAWHGPAAKLAAVLLNALYMGSGFAVGLAPFLPRETWPLALSGWLLSAAGLWAVVGRRA